jgi:hypothetical protein
MQSIVKALGIAALLAMVVGAATPAQAAPIVSIVPSSVTVNTSVEDEVTLDVLVTGLTEEIGGYSLDIIWNAAVMSWTFIQADPNPNFDPITVFFDPYSLDQGNVGILIAGDPVAPNTGLTDPLKILSIKFQGLLLEGQTNVDLANVHLSDKAGFEIDGVEAVGGVVCFARLGGTAPAYNTQDPNCQRTVPEPMTLSLLAAGLAGAVVRRRASKRS